MPPRAISRISSKRSICMFSLISIGGRGSFLRPPPVEPRGTASGLGNCASAGSSDVAWLFGRARIEPGSTTAAIGSLIRRTAGGSLAGRSFATRSASVEPAASGGALSTADFSTAGGGLAAGGATCCTASGVATFATAGGVATFVTAGGVATFAAVGAAACGGAASAASSRSCWTAGGVATRARGVAGSTASSRSCCTAGGVAIRCDGVAGFRRRGRARRQRRRGWTRRRRCGARPLQRGHLLRRSLLRGDLLRRSLYGQRLRWSRHHGLRHGRLRAHRRRNRRRARRCGRRCGAWIRDWLRRGCTAGARWRRRDALFVGDARRGLVERLGLVGDARLLDHRRRRLGRRLRHAHQVAERAIQIVVVRRQHRLPRSTRCRGVASCGNAISLRLCHLRLLYASALIPAM